MRADVIDVGIVVIYGFGILLQTKAVPKIGTLDFGEWAG